MSDELFEIAESPSPRLRWLRDHNLTLRELPNGAFECALSDQFYARGSDPDEAVVNYCLKANLKHWREE